MSAETAINHNPDEWLFYVTAEVEPSALGKVRRFIRAIWRRGTDV